MVGSKKNIRLFKVAKELNVSTTMLVEHLGGLGSSVEDSPNTKLSDEQYGMLLKEFASEKMLKEQAEQLSEKRREDLKTVSSRPEEEHTPAEEEPDKDILSAEQLRGKINPPIVRRKIEPVEAKAEVPPPSVPEPAPKEVLPTPEPPKPEPVQPVAEAPKPAPEVKSEPVVETPPPAQPEPQAPPVAEKPAPPVKKEELPPAPPVERPSALKVVGKIDLDSLNRSGAQRKKEEPRTDSQRPAQQPQRQDRPSNQGSHRPDQRQSDNRPAAQQRPADQRPTEQRFAKPIPVNRPDPNKPVPVADASKQAAPVKPAVPKEESTPKPEEAKEGSSLITAGSSTPQLSGLKVMGKIDLSPDRPKKDNSSKPATSTSSDEGKDDDDANKKRRRRRRKRKGNAPGTTNTGTQPSSTEKSGTKPPIKRGPGTGPVVKKEKPTAQEVDQSIKDTLSQMGRGANRSRQRLRRAKRDADAVRRDGEAARAAEDDLILNVTEFITANEFANLLNVQVNDVIRKSFELGMMVSINQRLDAELMSILAEEYGFEINFVDVTEEDFEIDQPEDDPASLVVRTPIVTVMGHVDHGKTTLLDNLRKANVAAGEAGGITQHIGAYEVRVADDRHVTFLDTPGHEAFTAMRARGAKVTDVAIIVIAADDAVMPQTREAINHAEAAGVPMVFAINKVDKAGADPERIKRQLAEMNYLIEEWGGKFQSQEISALKGQGVENLLEKVILESDLLELKANPKRSATGTVIESRLDKGRGHVATVLIQNGTLKVGDDVVAGIHYGKVRALIDQNGQRVTEAGPAKPVQLLGIGGSPQAGDKFHVFTEDGRAKELAQRRQELFREQQFRQTKRITLEEIGRRRAIGNFKELNVILRGDVDGSVEALSGALLKLSTEEVQVNIVTKGTGAITEADVNLAIASDAVLIAFNVRPNTLARSLAEREEVGIRTYSVIYDAINDVRDALEGLLAPTIKEEEMGTAEVLQVFRITKVGTVSGGLVKSGKIKRDDPVRVIRDGIVVHSSKLGSLKRFKDDVKEVFSGQEFGFTVDNYPDLMEGDIIESYQVNEIRRKL